MNSKKVKIFLKAQLADPGPPLGTVLGNLGITLQNFVKILMNILKIYLIILNYLWLLKYSKIIL